jgi:hypothetical protein
VVANRDGAARDVVMIGDSELVLWFDELKRRVPVSR